MCTLKRNIIIIIHLVSCAYCIKEMLDLENLCDLLSEVSYTHCYVKETLTSLVHSPNQLAVDNHTNTLYFSFDSGLGEYLPAVLRIGMKKLTVLKGVKDAFAIAHDPVEHEIYFGGSYGIYKYNPTLKVLKSLAVQNLDVWWLVLNHGIYFVTFPSLTAYYYSNRTVKAVHALKGEVVNQFAFDGDNNIVFINSSGLYGIKSGKTEVTLLKDNSRFLGIASNNDGHIHLCNENGIYMMSKMIQKVKKIVNVPGVLGLTFDRDNNIIYSNAHEIIRLKAIPSVNYNNFKNRND